MREVVASMPAFEVHHRGALHQPNLPMVARLASRDGRYLCGRTLTGKTQPGETPPGTDMYSFDPFAQHPFYARINHSLVQRAIARLDAARPKGKPVCVVDLASGTGAVTQLILDELEQFGRAATVIGIEPATVALEIARERLRDRAVQFVQGDADQLARVVTDADAVFLCNALHLIPDKPDVVRKITSVLAPDGFFACNSTFFTGAQTPESERFAHRWIRRAFGWLRQYHPDLHPTHRGQVAALAWLSADEYVTSWRPRDYRSSSAPWSGTNASGGSTGYRALPALHRRGIAWHSHSTRRGGACLGSCGSGAGARRHSGPAHLAATAGATSGERVCAVSTRRILASLISSGARQCPKGPFPAAGTTC